MMGDKLLLSTLTAGLSEDLGNAASNLILMTNPTFERAVSYLRLEECCLLKLRAHACPTPRLLLGSATAPRRPQHLPR
jgi:hypothetical protein